MKTQGNHSGNSCGLIFQALVGLMSVAATGEPTALAQPLETTASWTLTGSLNTARYGHTATLLPNGKVLVVGGSTEGAYLNSVELYDPATGTWRVTGSLNFPRHLCSTTLLANGKVLVAGGYTSTGLPSFGITNSAELYDPATETWSLTGYLAMPRAWHVATLLSNQVLVFAGWNGSSATNTVEMYDPDTGTWTLTGQLATSRYGATVTLLQDGNVLVAAGSNDDDLATTMAGVELHDPIIKTWKPTGSLRTPRFSHTATRLPSGMVLVAGGYTWPPYSFATSELYDPATEAWSYTGSLIRARDSHTATLLPNGKVLVAGGYDWSRRVFLDSTELYDPSTGTWSDTANLNTSRNRYTATLLLNGKVLIAGGAGGGNPNGALSGAELYDSGMKSGESPNAVP